MTPKPQPPTWRFPVNILIFCFSGKLKYVMFPLLLSVTVGLCMAFTWAELLVDAYDGGNNPKSHQLREDDVNFVPPEEMSPGENFHPEQSLFHPSSMLRGRERNMRHDQVVFSSAPDCSTCQGEHAKELGMNVQQYQQLANHSIQRFYGRPELTKEMATFTPREKKLWRLDSTYFLSASEICDADHHPLAVVVIPSRHTHFQERQAVRNTWGGLARGKTWPNREVYGAIRLVFLLGFSPNDDENNLVAKEADKYGDIVLADFEEDVEDSAQKVLLGIRWVIKYCSDAKYIIKTDEKSFIDMPRLLQTLSTLDMKHAFYGPVALDDPVIRDSTSSYYVSKEAYSPDFYPPHVKGPTYVIPLHLASKILDVAEYLPYVNLEDVHITGILGKAVEARHVNIPRHLYDWKGNSQLQPCDFVTGRRLAARDVELQMLKKIWTRVLHPKYCFPDNRDGQRSDTQKWEGFTSSRLEETVDFEIGEKDEENGTFAQNGARVEMGKEEMLQLGMIVDGLNKHDRNIDTPKVEIQKRLTEQKESKVNVPVESRPGEHKESGSKEQIKSSQKAQKASRSNTQKERRENELKERKVNGQQERRSNQQKESRSKIENKIKVAEVKSDVRAPKGKKEGSQKTKIDVDKQERVQDGRGQGQMVFEKESKKKDSEEGHALYYNNYQMNVEDLEVTTTSEEAERRGIVKVEFYDNGET